MLQIDILRIMGVEALKLLKRPYICIRLDTINSCNLRCKMCCVPNEVKKSKRTILPLTTFNTVLKHLSGKIRMLNLSCLYEPFTNPRFYEYLDVVRKYSIPYVSLVTNGTLLNEKIAESLVNNKITEITFSIDSTKADVYESIRRGAHFEKLLKNLDLLNRKKAEHGSEYPRMRLNFVVLPANYSEIALIVDFAAAKGFN
jgi:molybdenum cofactor biosynthesis enzyme MoaA